MRKLLAVLFLVVPLSGALAAVAVEQSAEYTHEALGLTVVGGTLTLPAEGFWTALAPPSGSGLRQLYLGMSEESARALRPPPGREEDLGEAAPPARATAVYNLVALRDPAAKGTVRLKLHNPQTGKGEECTWDLASAEVGDDQLLKKWAQLRAGGWYAYATRTEAPVILHWLSLAENLYGASVPVPRLRDDDRRGETADAFSVLGGRAAVRETLQMQELNAPDQATAEARTVAVSAIPGVEVQSHPFEEMLKGGPGGSLPLADCVPADRAFACVAKPSALLPLLDQGFEFLYHGGAVAQQNSIAYDLKTRYLARLGVTEDWLRKLLDSGAVAELALFCPDLFFIDGTEITVVARVPSAKLLAPVLKLVGVGGLSGEVTEHRAAGGTSYWALDGDLLVAGTFRGEVERALALKKAGGDGSLGRSAEFRYMLTQLPVSKETRFYAYLSDPFIRRLVGPEVKIGQLRRLRARSGLEFLTAAALLWKLDGQPGALDLATLAGKGYAPEAFALPDYKLNPDGSAESATWGSPAKMKSLLENPVDMAAYAEADAYRAYVENYSRFWRQYFDPIALRLDDAAGGRLELTTFILPLIDNSTYNTIREMAQRREGGRPLRVPQLEPKPVLQLSLNLADQVWGDYLKTFLVGALRGYAYVEPNTFRGLGPAVHVAIQDADPILAFGSGDLLGAFGGPMMQFGGRGGQMLFIPLALSILTRPCQIMIELQEPEPVVKAMRMMAMSGMPVMERGGPEVSVYQVQGEDSWVCSIGFEGIVKIRFGIEVRDGYFIIRNLPWSPRAAVAAVADAPLNGVQLGVNPQAGERQLASLYTAAAERERAAAMQGAGCLYPLMITGSKTIDEAAALHARLFGFRPQHPGKGSWAWENGDVRSSVYGDIRAQVQPAYKPGDRDFGTFRGVSDLTVNLQFEDTGLRVVSGWNWSR